MKSQRFWKWLILKFLNKGMSFAIKSFKIEKQKLHNVCPFCQSACIRAAPTGRIFVKFDTGHFYENRSRKFKYG
jgi:hypothetical protein